MVRHSGGDRPRGIGTSAADDVLGSGEVHRTCRRAGVQARDRGDGAGQRRRNRYRAGRCSRRLACLVENLELRGEGGLNAVGRSGERDIAMIRRNRADGKTLRNEPAGNLRDGVVGRREP